VSPEHHAAARAAEEAARRSYGKLVALLAARSRDIAGAEDALAEAFAAALADWPRHGVPVKPEAWLLTVARRRLVDEVRRRVHEERSAVQQLLLADEAAEPALYEVPDRRLGLLFACAHPAIDAGVRAPLMLQAVLGFDAAAIASAFLVAPTAMGQRLVRAKRRIREAGITLDMPATDELQGRLEAVLDAIYAAYAEGWLDADGTDARRRNLAEEAIWLGRLVAALLPGEPEALGLLALMLYTDARRGARRCEAGQDYVPLAEQDPARWDAARIDEAEALLQQASRAGRMGRFQLEAAVQSAHSVRRFGRAVDWVAIEQLYAALATYTASPVVALNRAVARAHSHGVEAGIALLDGLHDDPRLAEYQPYWAARAELLARGGRVEEALAAYRRAIGLERDPAVRRFLQRRLEETRRNSGQGSERWGDAAH
jgi:RNA polymerase sigma-70 factor (ECF subfamily)